MGENGGHAIALSFDKAAAHHGNSLTHFVQQLCPNALPLECIKNAYIS
jgi:hypothetical protein